MHFLLSGVRILVLQLGRTFVLLALEIVYLESVVRAGELVFRTLVFTGTGLFACRTRAFALRELVRLRAIEVFNIRLQ